MQVQGVIEVNASQDRIHIGLQEGDKKLQAGKADNRDQRDQSRKNAEYADAGDEGADESGEYLQQGVSRGHVGEQTQR